MKINKFEEIVSWKKSKELTLKIYKLFKTLKILILEVKFKEHRFL